MCNLLNYDVSSNHITVVSIVSEIGPTDQRLFNLKKMAQIKANLNESLTWFA